MLTRLLLTVLYCSFVLHLFGQTGANDWRTDLDFLQEQLPKRHPNLYAYYPEEAFAADLNQLKQGLEGKTDLRVGLELQTILAKFRDAQTRLELTPLLQKDKVIPLGLGWYADGLYVSGTVQKFSPALGKKVLGINRVRIEHVLKAMGQFFAQENAAALHRDGPQWLRFPAAFQMAGISNTDTLELVLEDEAGKQYLMKAFPLDFRKEKSGMQPAQFSPKSPDLRWNPMKQIYSLNWLEADSVVYIQYNACYSREMVLATGDSTSAMQLPPLHPLLDSAVLLLNRHPGARFCFDLRFNTGGMPADGIALAERLASLPAINRPDRLYVAVNHYTSGAAVEIAAAFQTKTRASLIGEMPPQRPNHFGEPGSLVLPKTGLQVFYGTRQVKLAPDNPETLELTIPLPLPFSDFRAGRDPVLDYVREHGVQRPTRR